MFKTIRLFIFAVLCSNAVMAQGFRDAYKLGRMLTTILPVRDVKISKIVDGTTVIDSTKIKNAFDYNILNYKSDSCTIYAGPDITVKIKNDSANSNVKNVSISFLSRLVFSGLENLNVSVDTMAVNTFALPVFSSSKDSMDIRIKHCPDSLKNYTPEMLDCYYMAMNTMNKYPYYALMANLKLENMYESCISQNLEMSESEYDIYRRLLDNIVYCYTKLNLSQMAVYYVDLRMCVTKDVDDSYQAAQNMLQVYDETHDHRLFNASATYVTNILSEEKLSDKLEDTACFFVIKACSEFIRKERFDDAKTLVDYAINKMPKRTSYFTKYKLQIEKAEKREKMAAKTDVHKYLNTFEQSNKVCYAIASEYINRGCYSAAYPYIAQAYWTSSDDDYKYETAYIKTIMSMHSAMAYQFLAERYKELGFVQRFASDNLKKGYVYMLKCLAQCQTECRDYEDAVKSYKRVIALAPDDADAKNALNFAEQCIEVYKEK